MEWLRLLVSLCRCFSRKPAFGAWVVAACLLASPLSQGSNNGSLVMHVEQAQGKLKIWLKGNLIYAGPEKEPKAKAAQGPKPHERSLIWIKNLPPGKYPLEVRFQDETRVTRSMSQAQGRFMISLGGCSKGILTSGDHPEEFATLDSTTLTPWKPRRMVRRKWEVLVGPVDSQLECEEDAVERALAQAQEAAQRDTTAQAPIVLRSYLSIWSNFGTAGNEISRLRMLTQRKRRQIVRFARSLTAPEAGISYSQDWSLRTGPSTFDCSGMVCVSYRKAGLDMPCGSVEQLTEGPLFYEVPRSEAKHGDLIVHLNRDDGAKVKRPNHVGIYASDGRDGSPQEISATPRGGNAIRPIDDDLFENSVYLASADSFGEHWRVYRWLLEE